MSGLAAVCVIVIGGALAVLVAFGP